MRSRCDLDAILEAGKTAPPKRRHTAKRIFERLRIEHGFAGGYTVAKDCVRRATPQAARGFHPARPSAGPRERIDSGECAGIAGVRGKPRVFRFGLPRPDACFVKAYPAETGADKFTQSAQARPRAFLDGHVSAFGFFGGVPISILYGNLKIAAARILGDGKFLAMASSWRWQVLGDGKFLAMASASADKFTRSAQA